MRQHPYRDNGQGSGVRQLRRCHFLIHDGVHSFAEAEILAADANARAFQTLWVEELRVIAVRLAFAVNRRRVFGIDPGERSQHDL